MTEEQLSALLRIKRFEQPPPQYFDRLLQDIHRRQRSELLRRPLWKIAAERMQTFFSEHSMSHVAYAGALASVVVVGVVGIAVLTRDASTNPVRHGRQIAKVEDRNSKEINPVNGAFSQKQLIAIETARPPAAFGPSTLPVSAPLTLPVSHQPTSTRYIIDPRPASFEPAAAYSF
jgi:hypothetical protein